MSFAQTLRQALVGQVKRILGGTARLAARQPLLRRGAKRLLQAVPALQPRVARLVGASSLRLTSASDLSTSAQRVHRRLRRQQACRKAHR